VRVYLDSCVFIDFVEGFLAGDRRFAAVEDRIRVRIFEETP
jgi:hypothetical protein